jgi:hypothetical protein
MAMHARRYRASGHGVPDEPGYVLDRQVRD